MVCPSIPHATTTTTQSRWHPPVYPHTLEVQRHWFPTWHWCMDCRHWHRGGMGCHREWDFTRSSTLYDEERVQGVFLTSAGDTFRQDLVEMILEITPERWRLVHRKWFKTSFIKPWTSHSGGQPVRLHELPSYLLVCDNVLHFTHEPLDTLNIYFLVYLSVRNYTLLRLTMGHKWIGTRCIVLLVVHYDGVVQL